MLWAGNWLGAWMFGLLHLGAPIDGRELLVDPRAFFPGLANVAALMFGHEKAVAASRRNEIDSMIELQLREGRFGNIRSRGFG